MVVLLRALRAGVVVALALASGAAGAQQPDAGSSIPSDWVGCDSTCRAKRANPKPEIVSPEVARDGAVTLRVYAPKAETVGVIDLTPEVVPMRRGAEGVWTYTSQPLKPGHYSYGFRIDGVDTLDPNNLWTVAGRQRIGNMLEVAGGEGFAQNDPSIPHGAIGEVFYRAPGVAFERRMRVYTPPGYGLKIETLPTLYLMHGGNGAEDEWGTIGRAGFILDKLIAEGRAKRMLVVMVDGYQADFRAPSGASPDPLTAEMLDAIVPYVEANYSASKDPGDRAIAGLSRGAAQTMTIARERPGAFGYVGIFSFSRSRVNPLRQEMEGLKTELDWSALRNTLGKTKLLYWTVGTEDEGYPDSRKVWDLFAAHHVAVLTETRPGTHEWAVWRAGLRDFAQKAFQ